MSIPRFFTTSEVVMPSGPSAAALTRVTCEDDRLRVLPLVEAMEQPEVLSAVDLIADLHDRRPAEVVAWQAGAGGEAMAIVVPSGVALTAPVQVTCAVSAAAARRLVIVMGEGSRATISISTSLGAAGLSQKGLSLLGQASAGATLADSVEVVLGTGAVLEACRLVVGTGTMYSVARAVIGPEAHLAWSDFHAGSGFRQSLCDFAQRGTAATVRYRSGAVGSGSLRLDEACRAVSSAARTSADLRSWSVVGKGDRVVSGGRVSMRHGAIGAHGHQRTHGLLLALGGEFIAQPDLEAENDEVVGGHGAGVSGLDPEGLFYLRSRGLVQAEAQRTMAAAFLAEAVTGFDGSGLEEQISDIITTSVSSPSYGV